LHKHIGTGHKDVVQNQETRLQGDEALASQLIGVALRVRVVFAMKVAKLGHLLKEALGCHQVAKVVRGALPGEDIESRRRHHETLDFRG
jgi:hypothetical protein